MPYNIWIARYFILLFTQNSKNVIFAILGKEQYKISGNPYIVRHLLLNVAYFALLTTAVYPIATIKKWKKKKRTKPLTAFDIIRHGILPLLLLCLPEMIGVPIWVIWYFVKDVCVVLLVSSSLLFSVGLYKIFYRIHWRMKMEKFEWIRCPVCGNKTRNRIKEDTELKNFPLYCPKCKHESLIEVKDLQITVIK